MTELYSTEDTIEYKKKIIDFIEGKIEAKSFDDYFQAYPQILDWLQSLVPSGMAHQNCFEVEIDYFLKKMPEADYNKIMSAYEAFSKSKNETLETQLSLAGTLVDLLNAVDKDVVKFNNLIIALLYPLKTVLDSPNSFKQRYLKEMLQAVRRLFEEKYLAVEYVPYEIKSTLPRREDSSSALWYYVELQSWLYNLMVKIFPDELIKKDETLSNKANFLMDVCPEYIDGPEVESSGIIERLVAEVPENIPKRERIKQIKNKIKQAFHIEGTKYPRWIQSAEWPMSKSGKPMRFIEQKREKGKLYKSTLYTHFIFEDLDTGEIKIIDQFT